MSLKDSYQSLSTWVSFKCLRSKHTGQQSGIVPFHFLHESFPGNDLSSCFGCCTLAKMIHFTPNKVKALLDLLIPKFQTSYKPPCNLSVDETMVGFRGRFGAKQYMPSKPTKYGIKAFTMADSEHGYMLNVLVYTGKDTLEEADEEFANLPQPGRIVMYLTKPYLGKGHHVFCDRYYSSIPLAEALTKHLTAMTGTIIKNRTDLPDTIRSLAFRLSDNEVIAFRDNCLLVLGWRAAQKKKPLFTLTTDCSANVIPVASRRTGRVEKPVVVDRYNYSMNGVDRADQYTVYYSFIRKSKKWWKKLFFWLLETTVVNSYILYRLNTHRPLTHLEYRRRIVDALARRHIQSSKPRPGPGRPRKHARSSSLGDPERLNTQQHFTSKRQEPQECALFALTNALSYITLKKTLVYSTSNFNHAV